MNACLPVCPRAGWLPCLAHTKAFTIGVFVGIRGVPREAVGDVMQGVTGVGRRQADRNE
jgi:hypothetical protein